MDALTKESRTMRRSVRALLLGAAAAVSALGCRSSCDAVERELHAREIDLLTARDELDRCHAVNEGMQTELQALRGDSTTGSDKPGVMAYPIRSLTLGRQTGGRDGDVSSGDESLQVIVEPRDVDNQVVKVPGSLVIQALEITPAGVKRPLSTWNLSEAEVSRSWRTGLLSTGYVFVLPWKVWPTSEKLRVVVQFRLPDGRMFEADKDVTVRVAPAGKRPLPPAPPPDGPPLLPPPHPVDPPSDRGPDLKAAPADPSAHNAAWKAPANLASEPVAQLLRPVVLPPCPQP